MADSLTPPRSIASLLFLFFEMRYWRGELNHAGISPPRSPNLNRMEDIFPFRWRSRRDRLHSVAVIRRVTSSPFSPFDISSDRFFSPSPACRRLPLLFFRVVVDAHGMATLLPLPSPSVSDSGAKSNVCSPFFLPQKVRVGQ